MRSDPTDATQQSHLEAVLSQKLNLKHEDYVRNGTKSGANRTQTLKDLLQYVDSYVQSNRVINVSRALTGPAQPPPVPPRQDQTRACGTFTVAATPATIVPCYFCQQAHLRKNCPLSRSDRVAGCRRNNFCYKCLAPFTPQHNVTCNKVCQRCRSRNLHHFLCPCGETRTQPTGTGQTGAHNGNTATNTVTVHVAQASNLQREEIILKDPVNYLGTVSVSAKNPQTLKSERARVLLDNGSQSSFVTMDLVRRLNLSIHDVEPMNVQPFGSTKNVRIAKGTTLYIQSSVNPSVGANLDLLVIDGTMVGELPPPTPELMRIAQRYGIKLADPPSECGPKVIDLLVGVRAYTEHFLSETLKVIKPCNTLGFVQTPFGWILQGGAASNKTQARRAGTFVVLDESVSTPGNECLCNDLQKILRDPLSEGDKDEIKSNWCEDYIASLIYNSTTKRYEAPLPWYNSRRPEPNYLSAFAHAQHLRRRLERDDAMTAYTTALMEFVDRDYARVLPSPPPRDGHYVSHFPVYKENSTTSIRPVFDGSAAGRGSPSLNSCMFKGAWDQTCLIDVILKWRLNPNVLLADIQQAFLQVKIKPEDRQYVRFLWFQNEKLQAYEMSSLLFGASASPFILYAVLKHLFDTQANDIASIMGNTYMDDLVLYADSLPALRDLLQRTCAVMNLASFHLHKFTTTSAAASVLNLEMPKKVASCLGVKWETSSDQITFVPPHVSPRFTRRGLASTFAKVFDLLGLLGPAHTRLKLFLHKVIESNLSWDDPIESELEKEARTMIADLSCLSEIRIPRMAHTSNKFELWGFGDASALAYGVALYLYDLDSKQSRLLFSRGHVAAKNKTIPRLELVAALLTAETLVHVSRCLPVSPKRTRLFTDSQVTWFRIQSNPSKYEPYVSTRLLRIQSASEKKDWFFIPGKVNPADLVSRGLPIRELVDNELWFRGPCIDEIQTAELVTTTLPTQVNAITTQLETVDTDYIEHLVTKLSYRTLRIIVARLFAHMSKFADLAARYKSPNGQRIELPVLTDMATWKLIQSVVLRDEIALIQNKQALPKGHSCRNRYLFIDEFGLVRLKRRLQLSNLQYEAQFPLVLMDHPAVRNYIKYVHETRTNHAAEPFAAPRCHLPADRVTKGYAFQAVSIDLFGPIRQADQGHHTVKFYGMIFACAKSRAIHLELIDSRSTGSVMRAFSRFADLYGVPKIIRSDNEASFEQLNKTFKKVYKDYFAALNRVQEEQGSAVSWIFNAPDAPSWGGFYERLIGPVKSAINKCRLSTADTFEKIETLLREAQRVVNSRPLLTAGQEEPLTPAHLVYGRPLDALPPVSYPMTTRDSALVEYSRLQKDLDQFWTQWNDQYLPTLQADRWPQTVQPEVGELVIIQKDGVPRHAWDLARIVRLVPGRDNIIRTVFVEPLKGGEVRRRAVYRLFPIERHALPPEEM